MVSYIIILYIAVLDYYIIYYYYNYYYYYYYKLIKSHRGMLELLDLLELTCPTACACVFKLRPGLLSKTLSHMWSKLNFSIL